MEHLYSCLFQEKLFSDSTINQLKNSNNRILTGNK